MLKTATVALACAILSTQAKATVRHDSPVTDRHSLSSPSYYQIGSSRRIAHHKKSASHRKYLRKRIVTHSKRHHRIARKHTISETRIAAQILPHPEGCPRTSFCGCGAALEVFGKNIRSLWLAANWFKFPKSDPGPGKVAVRKHHVFVIRKVLGPNKVLAYDANSGGHKTRLHERSLSGYSVRDPQAKKIVVADN